MNDDDDDANEDSSVDGGFYYYFSLFIRLGKAISRLADSLVSALAYRLMDQFSYRAVVASISDKQREPLLTYLTTLLHCFTPSDSLPSTEPYAPISLVHRGRVSLLCSSFELVLLKTDQLLRVPPPFLSLPHDSNSTA